MERPCQKCGEIPRIAVFYIRGERLCNACCKAFLRAGIGDHAVRLPIIKDTYRDIRDQHGESLDKLSEL